MSVYDFWKKIVDINYPVKQLYVGVKSNQLEIDIKFNNNKEYFNFLKKLHSSHSFTDSDTNCDSLLIYIPSDNIEELVKYFPFPSNIKNIIIRTKLEKTLQAKQIDFLNLPAGLENLTLIKQGDMNFKLTNCPINLSTLDVSNVAEKINLSYLPNGLENLYLPNSYLSLENKYYYIYTYEELYNLPSSLVNIIIGKKKFNSVEILLENYSKIFTY
jgi:hypothetical protein